MDVLGAAGTRPGSTGARRASCRCCFAGKRRPIGPKIRAFSPATTTMRRHRTPRTGTSRAIGRRRSHRGEARGGAEGPSPPARQASARLPSCLRPSGKQVADAAQPQDAGDNAEPDQPTFHVIPRSCLNEERGQGLRFQFSPDRTMRFVGTTLARDIQARTMHRSRTSFVTEVFRRKRLFRAGRHWWARL